MVLKLSRYIFSEVARCVSLTVGQSDPSTVPHAVKRQGEGENVSSRPSHRPGPDWLKEQAPSHRANLLPTLISQYTPIQYGLCL